MAAPRASSVKIFCPLGGGNASLVSRAKQRGGLGDLQLHLGPSRRSQRKSPSLCSPRRSSHFTCKDATDLLPALLPGQADKALLCSKWFPGAQLNMVCPLELCGRGRRRSSRFCASPSVFFRGITKALTRVFYGDQIVLQRRPHAFRQGPPQITMQRLPGFGALSVFPHSRGSGRGECLRRKKGRA